MFPLLCSIRLNPQYPSRGWPVYALHSYVVVLNLRGGPLETRLTRHAHPNGERSHERESEPTGHRAQHTPHAWADFQGMDLNHPVSGIPSHREPLARVRETVLDIERLDR